MRTYKKPIVVDFNTVQGILPLAGLAGGAAVGVAELVGLSAAKLLVAGVAIGLGVGAASRGNNIIDSNHMQSLTFHKDFSSLPELA